MNLKTTLLTCAAIVCVNVGVHAQSSDATPTRSKKLTREQKESLTKTKKFKLNDVHQTLNKSMNTVNFVQNEGQLSKEVLYTFTTPEAQMLVFKDKIRLIALHHNGLTKATDKKTKKIIPSDKHLVDISFTGANILNPSAVTHPDAPTFNYFKSTGNVTGVKAASELRFDNIYDGITLRLYSNAAGSLEFDWIVNNPKDYKKINMHFEGQDKLLVDNNGSLDLGLHFGNLKIKIPETYQVTADGNRTDVKCRFELNDNTVSYAINGKLHSNQPLVIDPVLVWGNYMDGNNSKFDAYLFGGDVDANGDYYIAGGSEAISYNDIHAYAGSPTGGFLPYAPDSTPGNYNSSGFGVDWLIMKIAKNGNSVLAYTFFGLKDTIPGGSNSTNIEQAHCLQVSPNGKSIFVGGITCSLNNSGSGFNNLPALSTGYTGNKAFGVDSAFQISNIPTIAVFSADLSKLKYRTMFGDANINGSAQTGDISSIEPLNDSDFIVASYVSFDLGSGIDSAYASAHLNNVFSSTSGGNNIYIAKFTNYNHRAWGTYIGGDGSEQVNDMRRLSNGDVVFCGSSTSTNASFAPALVNEVASTLNRNDGVGLSDGLVGIIAANGSSVSLLSKVGGSLNDQFNGLETGNCDTVFVIGNTESSDFPNVGAGVIQPTNNSTTGSNAVLFKFASTGGNSGRSSYFGGSTNDIGNSIAYLPVGVGQLFVFGTTQSTDLATANNISGNTFYQSTFQGGIYDIFFLECSPDFNNKYLATYLGGSGNDYLGEEGSPITGKQMRLVNDSNVAVFTTTHSRTLSPQVMGNLGVNSFDSTKSNHDIIQGDAWTLFDLNIKDVVGQIDAGDAPLSYGKATVKILDNGSGRALLTLGKKVDGDFYYPAVPGSNANVDDSLGLTVGRISGSKLFYNDGVADGDTTLKVTSDEDAISRTAIPSVFLDSGKYTVEVPYYNHCGGNASIYAYVDFDRNGVFEMSTGEIRVHNGLVSSTDTNRVDTFVFVIPPGAQAGKSYMRFIIVQGVGTPALTGCIGGTGYPKNQALGLGEIEDYPIEIYDINISGTVYDDANGNTDVTVNGTPKGTIGGVQLYANLTDNSNVVKAVQTLPSNGTFNFSFFDAGFSYTDNTVKVYITSTAGTIGSAVPSTTLPSNLVKTGKNFGLHNNAGSGNSGATDGVITVQKQSDSTSIPSIKFGIDQLDTAFAKSYHGLNGSLVEYASGNPTYPWKIPLNSTQSDGAIFSTGTHPFPGRVSGHDPEDGRYAGATGANNSATVVLGPGIPQGVPTDSSILVYSNGLGIDTLLIPSPQPTDPSFRYWKVDHYEIPHFNADALSVFGRAGLHYITFTYGWLDAANVKGATAVYDMAFSSPLPVELESFTATRQDRTSLINWTTASEKNVSNFDVQRSTDATSFSTIGSVAAKGFSVQAQNYTYTDKSPVTGINYYRLRLVDQDGSYKYSIIRSVNFDGPVNELKVYPNPTTGSAVIALVDATVSSTGSIAIYNMLGEQISTRPLTFTTGTNRIKVDITNLPNGFYQVKVMLNDQLLETKIEVIH